MGREQGGSQTHQVLDGSKVTEMSDHRLESLAQGPVTLPLHTKTSGK